MTRLLIAVAAALITVTAYAQTPERPPSQEETLAKWPWSISLLKVPFKQHSTQIKLAPMEGMELKYRLDKGAGMLYSWTSTGEVHWEKNGGVLYRDTRVPPQRTGEDHATQVVRFPAIN